MVENVRDIILFIFCWSEWNTLWLFSLDNMFWWQSQILYKRLIYTSIDESMMITIYFH